MRIPLALLAAAMPPVIVCAQPISTAELVRRIDSAGADLIAKRAAPAFAIGVSRVGRTVYARGFGLADLEANVAADSATVFLIGSITKQFTAAAIMQLVEQGKLRLDDRLTGLLPEWPAPADQVTIRQLLNHTSGIKSYTGLPGWGLYQRQTLSHDSLLGLVRQLPYDFPPGTDYRYNNSAYYMLGVLIEKLSGQTYPEYLRARMFGPLGMANTRYCDNRSLVPRRARGYAQRAGSFQNADPIDMGTPFAAGALCSTVGDLLAWTRALESGTVVSAESYRLMTTPVPLASGKPQRYGFGLATGEQSGHRMVAHGGGINGFRSQMTSYPADSVIVTVLTNAEIDLADRLERTIARWALGIPIVPPKNLAITAAHIERLSGRYAAGPATIRVWGDAGRLLIALPGRPTGSLLSQGDDRFVLASDPDLALRFLGNGSHPERIEIVAAGRQLFVAERQP